MPIILKFILIGSILSLSVAGAVFVLNSPALTNNSPIVPQPFDFTQGKEITGNNLLKNSPFVEKFEPKPNSLGREVSNSEKNPALTNDNGNPRAQRAEQSSYDGNRASEQSSYDGNRASEQSSYDGNLTQNFIKSIEKNIAENNPDGIQTVSGQQNLIVQDPEEITQNLIGEATAKFNAGRLNYLVSEKDLKVINDNSKQSLTNYAKEFQNIVLKAADQIPASAVADNPTPESVNPMVLIYENAIKKYYALPVPSKALTIHKKQIELLSKKTRALKEISNYQADPVTAILASGELEKIDQEFSGFYIQFVKFAESI